MYLSGASSVSRSVCCSYTSPAMAEKVPVEEKEKVLEKEKADDKDKKHKHDKEQEGEKDKKTTDEEKGTNDNRDERDAIHEGYRELCSEFGLSSESDDERSSSSALTQARAV